MMTGGRFPSAFGRAQAGPLQVSIPSRLPGGLWGPQPIGGIVEWDGQGTALNPDTNLAATTSQSLLQSEWPIPTRWELQLGLTLTNLTNGVPWNGAVAAFDLRGSIVSSVESAEVSQEARLVFGPGVYPLTAAINGVPGLSATFGVVGQTVRVRFDRLICNNDLALAGTRWAWSVSTVCGLLSSGWPSP
jgi:hypothetical protein